MVRSPVMIVAIALSAGCTSHPANGPTWAGTGGTGGETPPIATRGNQVDYYHGHAVADPYRWLESDSPAARAWIAAHDRDARAHLAALPGLTRVESTVRAAAEARRVLAPIPAGQRRFFVEMDGAGTAPSIYLHRDGRDRLLVDGDALAKQGKRVHLQLWPSPTGTRLAYGVGAIGSRFLTVRILDVDRSEHLAVDIVGVVAGRSSVSWLDGDRGLAYTRFDRPGDGRSTLLRNPRIAARRLDPVRRETLVLPAANDREVISHWPRGSSLVVSRRDDRGRSNLAVAVAPLNQSVVTELASFASGTYWYAGDLGGALVFATTVGAGRGHIRAVRVDDSAGPQWTTLIPETAETIDTWIGFGGMAAVIGRRVWVVYRRDAAWLIRIHDSDGRLRDTAALPTGTSMWTGLIPDPSSASAYVSLSGFADPGTVYRVTESANLERWRGSTLPYAPDDYVTTVVDYPRPGASPAPMFLAHRRGLESDGQRPILVYGYGWGAWSAAPWFRPHAQAFMDAGGVIALPIIRGGGERGEPWHLAGVRRHRQNAIDDYLAACSWLAASAWSRAGRIVAEGQSAGGSLVAMAVAQRPELFGGQILAFPVLDMLRYHLFTGAAAWKPEFGTVADADDFAVLRATSPVHNLRPGRCYPPTLILPGELDETTPPLHAYKYAAALQHAQGCSAPVWLRLARGTGHAYGRDAQSTAASLAAQVGFAVHAARSSRAATRR